MLPQYTRAVHRGKLLKLTPITDMVRHFFWILAPPPLSPNIVKVAHLLKSPFKEAQEEYNAVLETKLEGL